MDQFPRFIPLLLFLVQRKETVLPAKLCVMVGDLDCQLLLHILFFLPPVHTAIAV